MGCVAGAGSAAAVVGEEFEDAACGDHAEGGGDVGGGAEAGGAVEALGAFVGSVDGDAAIAL